MNDDFLFLNCVTSTHSVYFEGGFNPGFRSKYKGVIVNACHDSGYGHFAIRKTTRKVKGKTSPKDWVIWKRRSEKWYGLRFSDAGHSIEIDADMDMKNPSCKKLKFDKDTYEDLKKHIPVFLEMIGFPFETCTSEGSLTLKITEPFEISDGICTFPQGTAEIEDNRFWQFADCEEVALPDGLTRIGSHAFFDCPELKRVRIPESVKSIGPYAFAHCPLTDMYLASANPDDYVDLKDHALFGVDLGKITLHVPEGAAKAYGEHLFFKKFKRIVGE